MRKIRNLPELQDQMPGVASKREAKKLQQVLFRHGVEDIEEVRAMDNATLDDLIAEAEEE
jgi:hypothetical protein